MEEVPAIENNHKLPSSSPCRPDPRAHPLALICITINVDVISPIPLPSTCTTSTPPRRPHASRPADAANWHPGAHPPSSLTPLLLMLEGALQASPAQQAAGAEDEGPDDELVLARVAGEALRHHILLRGPFADGQVVLQAKGAVALGARGRGGARQEHRWLLLAVGAVGGRGGRGGRGSRRLGRRRRVCWRVACTQRNDGAILEACAFAECWRC